MRFIIGLICGAAVILLLTQALGTAQRDWLVQVRSLLDAVAVRVGDALDLPPRSPAATANRLEVPAAVPSHEASPSPAGAAEAGPLVVPAVAAHSDDASAGPPLAMTPADGAAADPAKQPIPRPPDPLPVDGDSEHPLALAAEQSGAARPDTDQPVWVPFHSEMSASGFADRLSESLDHPFRVERRGPGRYQVVFAYRDEEQRREVLSEAATVTGLPL